jgi:alpha/beta superfamily hydrolase
MSNGRTAETAQASLVDEVFGIREEIEFIGTGPERIFSTLHAPLTQPVGAVLLCSSIFVELLSGYQEEVWLSRRLAQRGIVVRRFHYRGTGHSDGEAEDVTYESACEDALALARRLQQETGFSSLGFVGTRVGALIAATIGRGFPDAPMTMIQPVLDGDRLFKEVSRARTIALLNEEGRRPEEPAPEDIFTILERERTVDILGYRLTDRQYQSVRAPRLIEELGPEPRPVQLIQVAKRKTIAGDYQRFLDDLAAKGFPVDAVEVNDEIAWWFHDSHRHLIPEIGDAIVPWLADRLTKEDAR